MPVERTKVHYEAPWLLICGAKYDRFLQTCMGWRNGTKARSHFNFKNGPITQNPTTCKHHHATKQTVANVLVCLLPHSCVLQVEAQKY